MAKLRTPSKKYTFTMSIFSGKKSVSASNRREMKAFKAEWARIAKALNGLGILKNIDDEAKVETKIYTLSKEMERDFKKNMMQNPSDWPVLARFTQNMRLYKMNPVKLLEDIMSSIVYTENPETGAFRPTQLFSKRVETGLFKRFDSDRSGVKIASGKTPMTNAQIAWEIGRVINSINPVQTEGGVKTYKPALVFSGNLMNSLYVMVRKLKKVGGARFTWGRRIETHTLPYGKILFEGGMTNLYVLEITRKSIRQGSDTEFTRAFALPKEFVSPFKSLKLGPTYRVLVKRVSAIIPERNPFFVGKQTTNALSGVLRFSRVKIGETVFRKLNQEMGK
jgi:hypothetical protein